MTDTSAIPSDVFLFDRGRLSQRHSTWTVAGAGAVTLGVLFGSWLIDHRAPASLPVLRVATAVRTSDEDPGTARLTAAFHMSPSKPLPDLADPDAPRPAQALALAPQPATIVPPKTETAMLAPEFVRGPAPTALADSAPLAPSFVAPAQAPTGAPVEAAAPTPARRSAPSERPEPVIALIAPLPEEPHDAAPVPVPSPVPLPTPQIEAPQAGAVPLPAPRPAFRWAAPEQYRASRRQMARNTDTAPTPSPAAPAAPADDRSFLERFFGAPRSPNGPTLAYASPEDGLFGRSAAIPASPAAHDRFTAIYDISAHTVYMPDGSRLEAHSGLGRMLDDPHHVGVRNVGPTPPHAYDLTVREALFHGVQALRLNPVGGGGVYGRTGLLAHTFMLGPNGDSNGCVSFRDYSAFLRAYQNGQVRRLVVVTGLS